MLDPMMAIDIAKKKLVELLGSTELRDLRANEVTLEELELADKSKAWDVTLGFPVPEPPTLLARMGVNPSPLLSPPLPLKKYKVVRIDRESGELVSMKNIKP